MPTSDFGDDFFEEAVNAPSRPQVVTAVVAVEDERKKETPVEPVNAVEVVSEVAAKDQTVGEINLDFHRTNEPPQMIGEGATPQFIALVERVREQYARLPCLVYSEVYTELSELTVPACATPTLQVINQELQKSQSAKDRVTELDIQLTQCLMLKDRAVDILKEAWNRFCDEKSADKRKGDAMYRLANFELDLAKTEAAGKAVKYVMENLRSLQDTLSRRITNIQLQIKLMDIGRTALPDFDFSKKSMDIQLDPQEEHLSPAVREDGTIEAKESDF